MRIESSAVSMTSAHLLVEKDVRKETLRAWVGDQRPNFEGEPQETSDDAVTLSAREGPSLVKPIPARKGPTQEEMRKLLLARDYVKILLIEAMTGKKARLLPDGTMDLVEPEDIPEGPERKPPDPAPGGEAGGPPREGWGLEYDYFESHYEKESVAFAAEGTVRTGDGREIRFDVRLSMNREFYTEERLSVRAGDAKLVDPLVIDLDGSGVRLTNEKYAFDLNSDGVLDQVSFASGGDGFLALDGNGDGTINSGAELFGPATGNGFAELSRHDADGNGWIDESDPVFADLRVWTKDASGADSLLSLSQAGVGAIFLGSVQTPFSLKDGGNQLDGQLNRTGIFLYETGASGTIQQVDLTV